jgi:hypothetical protein
MDVSSIEHVVIRAKLGDLIGLQLIQIAEQKASFHLTIFALVIEMVQTHRDLERYTCGLETCTASIL